MRSTANFVQPAFGYTTQFGVLELTFASYFNDPVWLAK